MSTPLFYFHKSGEGGGGVLDHDGRLTTSSTDEEEEGWGSATHALDELWRNVSAEEQAPFRDLLLSSSN